MKRRPSCARHITIHTAQTTLIRAVTAMSLVAMLAAASAEAPIDALIAGDFVAARALLADAGNARNRRLLAGLEFNGLGGPPDREAACAALRGVSDDPLAQSWAEQCPWTYPDRTQAATPLCAEAVCGAAAQLDLAAKALMSGHADRIGVSLELRGDDGATLLAVAASRSTEMVHALLERGADPNARNPRSGDTPLHLAARSGNAARVEALLSHGADPLRPNFAGETPLDAARSVRVRRILASAAPPAAGGGFLAGLQADPIPQPTLEELRRNPERLDAALRHAIISDAALLRRLLDDPEIAARCEARCPIHLAARLGRSEALGLLLSAGVEPEQTDRQGASPLALAVRHHHEDCVQLLWPADPDQRAAALLAFASDLSDQFVRAAIDDLDTAGKLPTYGGALLSALSASNRIDEAIALLRRGIAAKPSAQLVIEAAARHQPQLVTALLAAGADPNARDAEGRTALMLAAANDDAETLATLLKAGSEIDAVDRQENTALMYAARTAASRAYRLLYSAGADARRRNAFDHSAEEMRALKV